MSFFLFDDDGSSIPLIFVWSKRTWTSWQYPHCQAFKSMICGRIRSWLVRGASKLLLWANYIRRLVHCRLNLADGFATLASEGEKFLRWSRTTRLERQLFKKKYKHAVPLSEQNEAQSLKLLFAWRLAMKGIQGARWISLNCKLYLELSFQ